MQSNNQVTRPTTFYRLPKVREICGGVSASTVWAWVKKSKTGFPRPIKLSENCTAWNSADVEAWAQARIADSRKSIGV
jgi:predicted DNA-binding transcriptional regulator AlpA